MDGVSSDETNDVAITFGTEQTVTGPISFTVASPDEARAMAIQLRDSLEQNYFQLGAILNKVLTERWFSEQWGFRTFKDYVEGEVGFGYRKAMYLANIYQTLVASGTTWDLVRSVGWTKMREMCSVLNRENVLEWVEKARRMTAVQLGEEAKRAKLQIEHEGPVSAVKVKQFRLRDAQIQNVEQALALATRLFNVEGDAVALDQICTDFQINYVDRTHGNLEFILTRLSEMFNMDIEATPRTANHAEVAAQVELEQGEHV